MFCEIDQCEKTPSDTRSPATSATGPSTPGAPPRSLIEGRKKKIGLAVAGKPREADDFALARQHLPTVRLTRRAHPHANRRIGPFGRGDGACRARLIALDASHRGDELGSGEVPRGVGGDDLPVAHDDDAVAGFQDLAENVRNQHAAQPRSDGAAHIGEQLSGRVRVERGRRLVQDHEARRRVRDGEGAGDLDHLPPADREVLDEIVRADPMRRKDLVELLADQASRLPAPAEAPD